MIANKPNIPFVHSCRYLDIYEFLRRNQGAVDPLTTQFHIKYLLQAK